MLKTKCYETLEDGKVVEHDMYVVDAREAVINDPDRWSLTPPATEKSSQKKG